MRREVATAAACVMLLERTSAFISWRYFQTSWEIVSSPRDRVMRPGSPCRSQVGAT